MLQRSSSASMPIHKFQIGTSAWSRRHRRTVLASVDGSSSLIRPLLRPINQRGQVPFASFLSRALIDAVVFVWRPTHQLLADFLTKPVTGPHFAKLDDWIRCGLPWADRPILPPQPNAVFDIGVTAGADKFLQTITPRSAIVSSVSTADNFLSLCGQSAKLSEIDLGCVDLIDLFRVGSKDQSLH